MENRIRQWITFVLYDKGTNLIRPIFEKLEKDNILIFQLKMNM